MLGYVIRITLCCHLCFIACSQNAVYKEVKVPIKCDVEKAQKPKLIASIKDGIDDKFLRDLEKDYINFMKYSEVLENDLEFCRGQEFD